MRYLLIGSTLAVLTAVGPQGGGDTLNVEYDGLIEPSVTVKISSAVDGLIESTPVDRGDVVKKGDIVAMLESSVETSTRNYARAQTEVRALLDSSKIRMEFSARLVQKNKPLFDQGIISIEELDQFETDQEIAGLAHLQAQENMTLAVLDLRRSEAALALRTIRSPIDGVVAERFLTSGELVSRSKESDIMQIAQLDPLFIEVIAPIGLLGQVETGMEAEIRPEQPVGGVYRAMVEVVDRVVDAASSTFGIRLALPNPDYKLPAGLKCAVRFLK